MGKWLQLFSRPKSLDRQAGAIKETTAANLYALLLPALLTSYAVSFLLVALPYRLFPSDDLLYYQVLLKDTTGLPGLLSHPPAPTYIHPIYAQYLILCRELWEWLAPISPSFLVFANLLANMVSLTMIFMICRRVTGSMAWALAAGLLFATSAWTSNYYFIFSPAPFTVALILAAFTLQLRAINRDSIVHRLSLAACGLLLAVAFWCSPSAAVAVSLVMVTFPLLAGWGREERRQTLVGCICLSTGFAVVFVPYLFISGQTYLFHILDNINTYHYQDAMEKFGFLPSSPTFSFFRLLFFYSPLEALLFAPLATAATAFIFSGHRHDQHLRFAVILAFFCLAHAVAVDLLPTTKLGRTHFNAYPFLTLFLIAAGHWLFYRIKPGRGRQITGIAITLVLSAVVIFSIRGVLATRTARFALPEFVASQPQTTDIYLLRDDPHAVYIEQWLDDRRVRKVAPPPEQLIRESRATNLHGMLIVGPTGEGSGNSILDSAYLQDFKPQLPLASVVQPTLLPYYAFHPPFLFEEEICQALYFSGKIPKADSPDAQLKIFNW